MGRLTAAAGDRAITRLFRRRRIVQTVDLQRALGTSSRMTVWRHLRRRSYVTSFTDKGGYYALAEVPEYDDRGLWFHEGIGFSRHGTLQATVAHLVDLSEAGMTQRELRASVGVRAHDTLLALVDARRISRRETPGGFLYLSASPRRAAQQLKKHEEVLATRAPPPMELPAQVLIAILLEVVRAARCRVDAARIVSRLADQQIGVTEDQVEQTLGRLGIKKKRAP